MRRKIAIIGSSPIMLMHAIMQQESGNSVILFEKEAVLGGAWKGGERFSIKTDAGAHFLYYAAGLKGASKVLNEKFDLGLIKQRYLARGDVKLVFDFPEYSFGLPSELQNRKKFLNRYAINRSLKGLFMRNPYYSFEGGASGLIERLQRRFLMVGGEIRVESPVAEVEVYQEGKASLSLETQFSIQNEVFDRVIASARAIPRKVVVDGRPIYTDIESTTHTLTQAFLLVARPGDIRVSAYKFFHESVFLVVDNRVTNQENFKDDMALFTFAMQKDISPSSINQESLLDLLVSRKIVSEAAVVAGCEFDQAIVRNFSEGVISHLAQESKDVLEIVPYDNMSRALVQFYKRFCL